MATVTKITKEAVQERGFVETTVGWVKDLNTEGDANARILISKFFPLNIPAISLQVGVYTIIPLGANQDGLVGLDALLNMFNECHVDSAIGYEKDTEHAPPTDNPTE